MVIVTAEKSSRKPPPGPIERRVRAELRAAGWTATSVGAASTDGAIAVDLAQTQDRTKAARDKAALARELRIQLQTFRALSEPASKGDAVDEAADEQPGRGAGAPDPDRPVDGNVRPFGRRRPQAG